MKIIHSSGKDLKLTPGTVIEIERPNPFFSDYGEQSLPVRLAPDPYNLETLGYPGDLAATKKMPQRADATIQEGAFSIRCRQAILSAGDPSGIETSFYLNVGSFYEKMKDLSLAEVFKDKKISFLNVPEAIAFVRGLMVTPDSRFACFPLLGESQDTGKTCILNNTVRPVKADGYYSLANEVDTTEEVNGQTIRVPAGFYITPFIKAFHLLTEIFAYMGYTLEESFLSRTPPFSDMVFLNNNIDTIVNAEIRYDQIVPDCMASTVLEIFRIKFCCEFIPDETTKVVRIVLFDELMDQAADKDLTDRLVSKLVVNHAEKYKQIKLSSEKGTILVPDENTKLATDRVSASPDYLSKTLSEIMSAYPDAQVDKRTGKIYRDGIKGIHHLKVIVGNLNGDYYAGGPTEAEKKESPDVLVYMCDFIPFVGSTRAINSSIILDSPSSDSKAKESSQNKSELKPMLCFVYKAEKEDAGTVFSHSRNGDRLWDYSLAYAGPDGLYEKFWRRYDNLLRNSFRPVSGKFLLSDLDKLTISPIEKVVIDNQILLPKSIKYLIGENKETECEFLTTKPLEPVSTAKSDYSIFKDSEYAWQIHFSRSDGGQYPYFAMSEEPALFFPPPPTEAQFKSGGRFFSKTYAADFGYGSYGNTDNPPNIVATGTVTVWLVPVDKNVLYGNGR